MQTMKIRYRIESDDWTTEGDKITTDKNLQAIKHAVGRAPIIVEHRIYRGATSPHRLIFEDFGDFAEYLSNKACAGDSFYVWNYDEVCQSENVIAQGKCPAHDGCIPRKGAY